MCEQHPDSEIKNIGRTWRNFETNKAQKTNNSPLVWFICIYKTLNKSQISFLAYLFHHTITSKPSHTRIDTYPAHPTEESYSFEMKGVLYD